MRKIRWYGLIAVLLVTVLCSTMVMAAGKYPVRPITVLVPFAPGGTADINARAFSNLLEKQLGQPVKVVNKPTGGSLVAANEFVYSTKSDGYTIWYGSWSPLCLAPHLGLVDYKLEAFQPVCNLTDTPMMLVARAKAPYANVDEFIAYMKKNPGKVRAGTLGAANSVTLLFTMLSMKTKAELKMIPYGGGAETATALLKGDVDVIIQNPVEVQEYIKAGKFKYLASFSDKRPAFLANVPTFKEKKLNIVVSAYKGVYVPKGTPKTVVKALGNAFKKVAADASFRDLMKRTDQEVRYETAGNLYKRDKNLSAQFKEAVAGAGLSNK
jgi:tripartite-type tricarboxylate transporter receptor subunit TctC